MATGLIDIMKRAAIDANEAANYTDLKYGIVTKVNPLEVTITTTFVLPQELLIVPRHLTNYTVHTVLEREDHTTLSGTTTMYNALKVNDKIALIREHGGRKYYILDRI